MRHALTLAAGLLAALCAAAPAGAAVEVTQVAGTQSPAATDMADGTHVLGAPMSAWSVVGINRSRFVYSDQCSVVREVKNGAATRIAGTSACGESPTLSGPAFGDAADPLAARLSTNVTLSPGADRDSYLLGDIGYHRVRLLDERGITTLAGSGTSMSDGGFADGPAASARFNQPSAVAMLADGSVLVADSGNGRVRRIAGGVVTTVAGGGTVEPADGVRATDARFGMLIGLAVLPGDVPAFSDANRGVVWSITRGGTLRRLATANVPFAIAAAGSSLVITELASSTISAVAATGVRTVLATTVPMPISVSAVQCGKSVFAVSFQTGGVYRIDNPGASCK